MGRFLCVTLFLLRSALSPKSFRSLFAFLSISLFVLSFAIDFGFYLCVSREVAWFFVCLFTFFVSLIGEWSCSRRHDLALQGFVAIEF